MNYLFYSLVDIVDSCLHQTGVYPPFHMELKSSLYDILKPHFDELLEYFYIYNYPNIEKADIESFTSGLLDLVEEKCALTYDEPKGFYDEYLRQIVKQAKKDKELSFLQDEVGNLLFDGYEFLYLNTIIKFEKSKLVFDNEPTVKKKLKDGVNLNCLFIDSNKDIFIQLSDVIVGFVSKLYAFVEEVDKLEMEDIINTLDDISRENLRLYFEIESYSNNECQYFFESIAPSSTREKICIIEQLLFNKESAE